MCRGVPVIVLNHTTGAGRPRSLLRACPLHAEGSRQGVLHLRRPPHYPQYRAALLYGASQNGRQASAAGQTRASLPRHATRGLHFHRGTYLPGILIEALDGFIPARFSGKLGNRFAPRQSMALDGWCRIVSRCYHNTESADRTLMPAVTSRASLHLEGAYPQLVLREPLFLRHFPPAAFLPCYCQIEAPLLKETSD